jgi:murein DD-endopeptidase MepM/ murein hydrolase activator NlpD
MRVTIVSLLASLLLLSAAAAAEPLVHVIAKGETIYSIARSFNLSPEALLKANGISDPTRIRLGQTLSIPQSHRVDKGDTLFSIAKLYNVTVDALRAANSLTPKAVIFVGQVLLLPLDAGAATTAPSKTPAPSGKTGEASSGKTGDAPAFPPLVKTSPKAVDNSLAWPCSGEARYLDGKIEGIMFLTEKGVTAKSVAGGRVVSAGPYRGFGQVVFVESKNGYIYVYGGNETVEVRVGDTVRVGQELGTVGFDAREGRAALYFFVFKNGESLDPARAPRG